MSAIVVPSNEEERLRALYRYEILDTPPEKQFDDITALLSILLEMPIVMITFLNGKRQWCKSVQGIGTKEIPRIHSICSHAILKEEVFVVSDTLTDPRFKDNPLVLKDPRIRFYASAPLITPDGYALGTLCCIDNKPREFSQKSAEILRLLASQVMILLEVRIKERLMQWSLGETSTYAEALREKEERLQLILQSTNEVIFDLDVQNDFLWMTSSLKSIFGYDPREMESGANSWISKIHPDDQERIRKILSEILESGDKAQADYRVITKDQRCLYVSGRGTVIRDQSGKALRVIGALSDVTSQIETENSRNALLHRFQLQMDRMPIACITNDSEFRINYLNPAAEKMFGFTREEACGKHPDDLIIPPQSREHVREIFERLRQGDMSADGISENCRKDGSTIICEWHNTPLHDSSGKFEGIMSMAQDVTERTRAERAIRESEEKYRRIVEESSDVIYTLSSGGKISEINKAGLDLLGFESKEEAVGFDFRNLYAKGSDRISYLEKLSIAESAQDVELELVSRTGRRIQVLDKLAPLVADDGSIIQYRGIMKDVTGIRELQQQLFLSQKIEAIGRLAGGVAHDFNNLLMAIGGFAEILQMKLPPDNPAGKDVANIIDLTAKGAALTRQLLAFGRRQVMEPRVVDLNRILSGLTPMMERIIGEDIELISALNPNIGSIKADPSQLEQVVMNLVVNARDAMPSGGKLLIETSNVDLDEQYTAIHPGSRIGKYVLLSVTDNGAGMIESVKNRIFEPFFTTKELGMGTGLGLATVYGIVKQSDGYITVDSEPSQGACFKIYFPWLNQPAEQLSESTSVSAKKGGHETLLLVDDNDAVREAMSALLEKHGYTVLQSDNGPNSIELAGKFQNEIHLLITDIVMPQMSGHALAELLRQSRPGIKVLFMSGYSKEAVEKQGRLISGSAFLSKPASLGALLSKVREVIENKK